MRSTRLSLIAQPAWRDRPADYLAESDVVLRFCPIERAGFGFWARSRNSCPPATYPYPIISITGASTLAPPVFEHRRGKGATAAVAMAKGVIIAALNTGLQRHGVSDSHLCACREAVYGRTNLQGTASGMAGKRPTPLFAHHLNRTPTKPAVRLKPSKGPIQRQ
jgi:hypothetical protein